jgi:His/Glu/Gln/Arg/opine family amino acid ABC transporter permease subunit
VLELRAMFDPAQVTNNLAALLAGAWTTLLLSATAVAFAAVVGVLLAVLRSTRWRALSLAARAYIELIRGTPLLVQMYILYYGLPSLGITLSPFIAAATALALNSAAYIGEILRSAVQSVERSQRESGRAVGMSYVATQVRIVFPQALPIALPSLTGEVVDIVKWSSLASVVVVPEATQVVYQIVSQSYRGFAILFLTLAAYYLVVTASLAWGARRLEARITRYRARIGHA